MFLQGNEKSLSGTSGFREHLAALFQGLRFRHAAQHGKTLPLADPHLVEITCRQARSRGLPVYLFGASNEKLAAMAVKLIAQFPGLRVAGWEATTPEFDPVSGEARDAVHRIAESGARLCLVILGASKEPRFAKLAREYSPNVGFVCVGAGFN